MSPTIWDAPTPTGTSTLPPTPPVARDVPVDRPGQHLYGTEAGPLLTGEGRGVKNGVPYGQQLQAEQQDMDDQYRLRPSFGGPLRAATRAALRR